MSLALIERLFGAEAANTVARLTEYVRQTDPEEDPETDETDLDEEVSQTISRLFN